MISIQEMSTEDHIFFEHVVVDMLASGIIAGTSHDTSATV